MRRRFTLIELLVVIAIIAILAAILLPALNRARNSSRGTKCISQLNQMQKGLIMYGDIYNGIFPGAAVNALNTESNTVGSSTYAYLIAGFHRLVNRAVLYCPSQTRYEPYTYSYITSWEWGCYAMYNPLHSWDWSGGPGSLYHEWKPVRGDYAFKAADGKPFFSLNKMKQPSATYLLADNAEIRGAGSARNGITCFQFSPRQNLGEYAAVYLVHNGKANLSFADGHVAGWGHSRLKKDGFTRIASANLELLP